MAKLRLFGGQGPPSLKEKDTLVRLGGVLTPYRRSRLIHSATFACRCLTGVSVQGKERRPAHQPNRARRRQLGHRKVTGPENGPGPCELSSALLQLRITVRIRHALGAIELANRLGPYFRDSLTNTVALELARADCALHHDVRALSQRSGVVGEPTERISYVELA